MKAKWQLAAEKAVASERTNEEENDNMNPWVRGGGALHDSQSIKSFLLPVCSHCW